MKEKEKALQLENLPHLFFHSSTSYMKYNRYTKTGKKERNFRIPILPNQVTLIYKQLHQEHIGMETEHLLNLL